MSLDVLVSTASPGLGHEGFELLEEHGKVAAEYTEDLAAIRKLGLSEAEEEAIAKIEGLTKDYVKSFGEVADKFHEIETDKELLDELGEQIDEKLSHVLHEHEADLDKLEQSGASRAAVAQLASGLQIRTVVADFGTTGDPHAATEDEGWAAFESVRVAPGTADITEGAAMSRDTALDCVRAGIKLFERDSKGWDVDLVGLGDLGLGSTTSACAIAAALTGLSVEHLCGEAGNSVAGRPAARAELVRLAVGRTSPDPDDAIGLLAEYGGLEMAALTGICLAAAANHVPVLLDGVVSTAAGILAVKLAPATRSYLIVSHEAAVAAHGAILAELGLEPLLKLRLGLGEGVGAVLAMGLVEAAWTLAQAGKPA